MFLIINNLSYSSVGEWVLRIRHACFTVRQWKSFASTARMTAVVQCYSGSGGGEEMRRAWSQQEQVKQCQLATLAKTFIFHQQKWNLDGAPPISSNAFELLSTHLSCTLNHMGTLAFSGRRPAQQSVAFELCDFELQIFPVLTIYCMRHQSSSGKTRSVTLLKILSLYLILSGGK